MGTAAHLRASSLIRIPDTRLTTSQNTGEAPRFRIGYQMAAMFFAIEILLTLIMAWLWRGRNTSGVDLKEDKDIALAPRQEKDQAAL